MPRLPFSVSTVAESHEALLAIESASDGHPIAATAAQVVNVSPARLWEIVSDPVRFTKRLPMIDRVSIDGDRVKLELRFKVALFSFGFRVDCISKKEEGKSLELVYGSGEPRNTPIRFDIEPIENGTKSVLFAHNGFDIFSLGWLVKTFLKHHPEIRYGVYPGSALSLLDAVKRTAEER